MWIICQDPHNNVDYCVLGVLWIKIQQTVIYGLLLCVKLWQIDYSLNELLIAVTSASMEARIISTSTPAPQARVPSGF